MKENYLMLVMLIGLTAIKAAADGFNYRFNISENTRERKRYGIIYHLFGLLLIALPLLFIYFTNVTFKDFGIITAGFALMYFGLFDFIYNSIAGRNLLYIGNTDLFDRILSRMFKTPTLKGVLMCLRWLCFCFGMYLIIDVLKF